MSKHEKSDDVRLRTSKPNPEPRDPADAERRIAELEKEIRRKQEELRKAKMIIEVQRQVAEALGIELPAEKDERASEP